MKETTSAKNVRPVAADAKPLWEPPKLEEVSSKVMAQPYIRFT